MIVVLIALALAFLVQAVLGFFQIRHFVKVYRMMCSNGKVLIGKKPKRLQRGTIMLMNINNDGEISNCKLMNGVTVFARFKSVKSLDGKTIDLLASSHDDLMKYNPLVRGCILNAYRNYVNYKTGKLSQSDFDTSVSWTSLPMVDYIKAKYYSFVSKKIKG